MRELRRLRMSVKVKQQIARLKKELFQIDHPGYTGTVKNRARYQSSGLWPDNQPQK